MEETRPTCRVCGTTQARGDPDAPAWGWQRTPDGLPEWLCPGCARAHVRDIEAKLPDEWW